MIRNHDLIKKDFEIAKKSYEAIGVDVEQALKELDHINISMHCWQGDDLLGFEGAESLTGGIMATGNYKGKARNATELRRDIDTAMSLIPGKQKLSLHAMYLENAGKGTDRSNISIEHFENWVEWAKKKAIGLDFNPSVFSHEMLKGGMSLSHPDKTVRDFWIKHVKATREIANYFGKELNSPCVNNIWIPDGMKDYPADRMGYRARLKDSLDEILEKKYDKVNLIDTVESKLFGLGSESFVAGSHEFYMGYAMKNDIAITLDSGHFHPTETIADKISSIMLFLDTIALHVSRGVRWDSDHIVSLTDDTKLIARECIKSGKGRIHYGLDFFDGSINRIAAWVIGTRAFQKALLIALLEPEEIKKAEDEYDYTTRLALFEEVRQLNWGAVYDEYCLRCNVPVGFEWIDDVKQYELDELTNRH